MPQPTYKQLKKAVGAWQKEALELREVIERLRKRRDVNVSVADLPDGPLVTIKLAPKPKKS